MITAYVRIDERLRALPLEPGASLPDGIVWLDVLRPDEQEREEISAKLGVDLPTREDMSEIEASSRLYTEENAAFLTTSVMSRGEDGKPALGVLTLVLTPTCLITVRHTEPLWLAIFAARAMRHAGLAGSSMDVMLGILEAVVDRAADVLEMVAGELDTLSRQIFSVADHPTGNHRHGAGHASSHGSGQGGGGHGPAHGGAHGASHGASQGGTHGAGPPAKGSPAKESRKRQLARQRRDQRKAKSDEDLRLVIAAIGRAGDLTHKVRDSLAGLERLTAFATAVAGPRLGKDQKLRLKTIARDVHSLVEHAAFQAMQTNFLLDATLGVINIQQTNIIKIFSVAAAAFLPPTLIASIYGMNFTHMPELGEVWGYPVALVLMVLSAVLPLWYFRRKGWL
ncbi:MAG: magnesium transport protein CorA [Pseudomonadota bacterium]